MTYLRPAVLVQLVLALGASPADAQSVVVDQGSFSIQIHGQDVGSEDFSIRRAGFNRSAAFIANGVISLRDESGTRELRPLLRASGPDGAAEGYQLALTGASPLEITMNLARPRFVSRFESIEGLEEREFRARPETRIVEAGVAHHFYFLRDLTEGDSAPIIVPSERREAVLLVGPVVEEELRLGRNRVPARRVSFMSGDIEHRVWFDTQGRVLKVEIPELAYVAERQDLVG